MDLTLHFLLCELREAVRHGSQPGLGICAALDDYMWEIGSRSYAFVVRARLRARFRQLYMLWPHYSGDEYYPVPSAQVGVDAEGMYDRSAGFLEPGDGIYQGGGFWRGEYGRLRKNLLDFTIAHLEQSLSAG